MKTSRTSRFNSKFTKARNNLKTSLEEIENNYGFIGVNSTSEEVERVTKLKEIIDSVIENIFKFTTHVRNHLDKGISVNMSMYNTYSGNAKKDALDNAFDSLVLLKAGDYELNLKVPSDVFYTEEVNKAINNYLTELVSILNSEGCKFEVTPGEPMNHWSIGNPIYRDFRYVEELLNSIVYSLSKDTLKWANELVANLRSCLKQHGTIEANTEVIKSVLRTGNWSKQVLPFISIEIDGVTRNFMLCGLNEIESEEVKFTYVDFVNKLLKWMTNYGNHFVERGPKVLGDIQFKTWVPSKLVKKQFGIEVKEAVPYQPVLKRQQRETSIHDKSAVSSNATLADSSANQPCTKAQADRIINLLEAILGKMS